MNTSILEAINNSQLNTSVSKAMFSFTKAERFSLNKLSSVSFYQKPSTLHQRSTSFGYGKKVDIASTTLKSPSPDKYQMKSDFQQSPKKGITIAVGRQNCKNVSIFKLSNYPAPTDYSINDKENTKKYSMRAKLKLPELFPDEKNPGPGQYISQPFDINGKAFISKYKKNICYKIHQKSPRLQKKQYPGLGPLSYNTVLPANGKQILSKKRTQKSFYFDKRPRVTMLTDTVSPGPGAYRVFSQFNR